MGERRLDAPRCASCRLLVHLCVCALIERQTTRTHVVCVLHPIEARKPTNTSHLLPLALTNAECRLRGERGQDPLLTDDLRDGTHTNLLLFPGEETELLSPELVRDSPLPVRLLVPDGTWKQASRIARRLAEQIPVRRIGLAPQKPSSYRLRKPLAPHALCTFEAVVEALALLEGEALRPPLEELLRTFVDRTLWSRGTLSAHRVHGGISREAATWTNRS